MNKLEALEELRGLFNSIEVDWKGNRRTWFDHITRNSQRGFVDEEILVRPLVFPAFAKVFLDFDVGVNLAAESSLLGGTPDFTPADRLTQRFVFETKGSSEGTDLSSHMEQVTKYLERDFTKEVVLTNLVGIVVYSRNDSGQVIDSMRINLRELARREPSVTALLPESDLFMQFIERFKRRDLTTPQKIDRIRQTPQWVPSLEVTDSDWLRARIQTVVDLLQANVSTQIGRGQLLDPTVLMADERGAVLDELRQLAIRLQVDVATANGLGLSDFLAAGTHSIEGKALRQYEGHVAYWLTTKLVLSRVWEDIGLIDPASLYNGGFNQRMISFQEDILDVIDYAFRKAENHYKALFVARPTYSWFRPDPDIAVDALYELATTYFGDIESDVLGRVYEGTLQKIDRKLLGQYYTPRDIIALIWDLMLPENGVTLPDSDGQSLRVFDVAAGSGGFLVEGIARSRKLLETQIAQGSSIDRQEWLNRAADGFNGVEIQRFSSFLAELNLLIQFGQLLKQQPELRIPELGIVPADTLSLHGREHGVLDGVTMDPDPELIDAHFLESSNRLDRAQRIKDAGDVGVGFDVVVGNPPYIGEKIGAELWRSIRGRFPYWNMFAAPHVDYLYPFLIVGISKLRLGGRFGFITTEYWLRSVGAAPLRKFISDRCKIERIILFRDLRLFPDAPDSTLL